MRPIVVGLIFLATIGGHAQSSSSYQSFTQSMMLNTGFGVRMVSDSAGNTLVLARSVEPNKSGYVAKIAPDGKAVYQPVTGDDLAFGEAGSFWVAQSFAIAKFDASANHLADVPLQSFAAIQIRALACDATGNVYVAANAFVPGSDSSGSMVVFKFTAAGKQIASYPVAANATPEAIAVDSSGAAYVVGRTNDKRFPTTPGAFMESNPSAISARQVGDAFVMKLSSGLDKAVYSTLIGGEADSDAHAVAVDNAGNAFVGGYGWVAGYPQMKAFPLSSIGLPLRPSDYVSAYVLKLDPTGSKLIYSAGLCAGEVLSIALAPEGKIHAVADVGFVSGTDGITAGVFTISAAGDRIERDQFLNGVAFQVAKAADISSSSNGAIRVMATINSTRFPVVWGEGRPGTPVIVDLPAVPVEADVSVSATAVQPVASGGDLIQLVSLLNAGPGDAESVLVYGAGGLSCISNGVSNCANVGQTGQVVVSKIRAGETVWLESHQRTGSIAPNTTISKTASILALSSDTRIANNNATVDATVINGDAIGFRSTPLDLYFYRSEYLGRCQSSCSSAHVSFPVTVTAPSPQRWNGNWWRFDSWNDGATDNPRTFNDAATAKLSPLMNFQPAQPIGVDPPSLDFVAIPGSAPLPRSVAVYRTNLVGGKWSAGGQPASWLTLTGTTPATGGSGDAIVSARADITGLSPGYYTTSFTVEFEVAGQPSQTISVPATLRILDKSPTISANGIVDAASFRGPPVSPQELVTIFGTGLGPPSLQGGVLPAEGQIPTSLGGTRVLFNGIPGALFYVTEKQVAAMIPESISGAQLPGVVRPLQVTVELGGVAAASTTIGYADFAPGLFTADSSGSGSLAAVNEDGSINSSANPARRGSVVSLYGTGFAGMSLSIGAFPGTCRASEFGSNLLAPVTSAVVDILVAGEPAESTYAGSVPGVTCSLQQINVVVPEDSPIGGAVPVTVRLVEGGTIISAQTGVTIAVK